MILAVANEKGGVGKTTVTCLLGQYLASQSWPTLLIELDHQMNIKRSLGRGASAVLAEFTSVDVLEGRAGTLPAGDLVLVPGHADLIGLERQTARHNEFANALNVFLQRARQRFAVCLIDTNPNPDVRYVVALAVADWLLSPMELNQEAIDGIGALLHDPRHGYHRIREVLNPKLQLIGILPNMVEATAFQRANLRQLVQQHPGLLIPLMRDGAPGFAYLPNRTAVAEAQAAGVPLWQLRQAVPDHIAGKVASTAMPLRSAARDAWREIRPSLDAIIARMGLEPRHGP
jgi:chromosome partitioning protein